MKKLLSSGLAVLAAGLLAASLTACKDSSSSDNKDETYTPSASTDSGSTSTSTSSGTSTSTSTTSGTRVVATGTAPAGFVAVDGRTGGRGDITPLFVCDHEVTQGEYETYCNYGGEINTSVLSDALNEPTEYYGKGSSYPAYVVSWYDALVYCNLRSMAEGLSPCYSIGGSTDPASWPGIASSGGKYCGPSEYNNATWDAATYNASANGYRLPTVEEWKYLAMGGFEEQSYLYPGSNDPDGVAWYEHNSHGKTHEVKGDDRTTALNSTLALSLTYSTILVIAVRSVQVGAVSLETEVINLCGKFGFSVQLEKLTRTSPVPTNGVNRPVADKIINEIKQLIP